MNDVSKELGVQSYCFRGFKSNDEVAAKVKECGLSCIELCGVHTDFSNVSQHEPTIAAYRKAGVKIVAIGVQGFNGDAAKERTYFEFAKKAGADLISCDFGVNTVPASFRVAEKLADEYNINLGIHNHGGRHWLGAAQMIEAVFKQTSPRVGLMLDTAWALHSHEDPINMITRFKDRVYGLHVKDFTFDRAGNHQDVVVGTGNLNLKKMFEALSAVGFKGHLVLEYEGDVANPVPALRNCVEAVRKACVC